MANIYDGVFRTILNDCRRLIIPVINEIFGETYTGEEEICFFPNEHFLDELEQRGVIGAFDKRTIIELSGDVIIEIAQKYGNVQKGVGDIMGGALIETEARIILNQGIKQGKTQGISETKKLTALRMLKMGKLTVEEIAECSELSVAEVEQLAGLQTV